MLGWSLSLSTSRTHRTTDFDVNLLSGGYHQAPMLPHIQNGTLDLNFRPPIQTQLFDIKFQPPPFLPSPVRWLQC